MTWDARAQDAARVLQKAEPLLDFDPGAYLDDDTTTELEKALGKVRASVMGDLWAWDYYRMEASATAADTAALEDAGPEEIAWAFLRRLLDRQ